MCFVLPIHQSSHQMSTVHDAYDLQVAANSRRVNDWDSRRSTSFLRHQLDGGGCCGIVPFIGGLRSSPGEADKEESVVINICGKWMNE